ncbi:bifunctional phosphopantothenoylcysteine decarboxylase/phosphopantothenate synthase [Altererythrobacter sp. CAU 1778]
MSHPRILLVVGGGIAAYKSCELVRLIRKAGGEVTCVLTDGGQQFVTPMTLAALSENPVYTTLWDLKNEAEMGHIQLSREADLVVVCPATADLMAKMAAGVADDLATTLLLATDKPVMCVPAMNVKMWQHETTQRNVDFLRRAGVRVMEPDEGPMACGEFGPGRLPEPEMAWLEIADALQLDPGDAGAGEIEAYLEALEPEDADESDALLPDVEEEAYEQAEEPAPRQGGLSGLLASIIPRSTRRRNQEEIEEAYYAEPEIDDAPQVEEDVSGELSGEPEPESAPLTGLLASKGGAARTDLRGEVAAAGASLLAGKGAARAAPPTDAQAINHTVSLHGDAAAPQSAAVLGGYSLDDPLEGQPAFDIDPEHRPLFGKHVLVTAGPTHERIDPVRYIANRSSGKQGFAIAAAAATLGARVTLVAGPVHLATPPGVDRVDVETALEMAQAVKSALPADAAVMVAAVADWRLRDTAEEKIKKRGSAPPALILEENPDILATVASGTMRPRLLVGFAAETNDVLENARKKRRSKGADWIVANDVSFGERGSVMGGASNTVHIVQSGDVETWDEMPKEVVAMKLVEKIADALNNPADD